jgi:phage tail sheath protein FI
MASYKTPGVYVEEISKFPPSVAQVATAIPAFIGYTQWAGAGGLGSADLLYKPTRITSMLDYETYFGFPDLEGKSTKVTLAYDSTLLTWSATKVELDSTKTSNYTMYYSMQHFFMNGGGPCYITSVAHYQSDNAVDLDDLEDGLAEVKKIDEVTLLVFPDATNMATSENYYVLQQASLVQSGELGDRFSVIDIYEDSAVGVDAFRDAIGTKELKYGAAYYPFLETTLTYAFDESKVEVTMAYDVNTGDDQWQAEHADNVADLNAESLNGALDGAYNVALAALKKQRVTLAPSSAIVGVYAYVDRTRGVWKAPANVSLSGVIKPTVRIDNAIQDNLNVHGTGKSINAIRSFTGKGVLVWGSRTLAGNDAEWRYVPVRRLFNMVEESIQEATSWAVFEPNDANTWVKLKGMIDNYLTNLWKAGALAGAKPDQAFYVNVGLGTTMTAQNILDGFMNVEIGMAAVRPAEFIILKFSHKLQEA